MPSDPDVRDVAAALRVSIGLLLRQMRQVRVPGELSVPETSALARLDRGGPATSSALARIEQISPQSMGATLSALEARGLVERGPDAQDGRRVVLSVTAAGRSCCGTSATRGPGSSPGRCPPGSPGMSLTS